MSQRGSKKIFTSRGKLMFAQVREDAAVDQFLLEKVCAQNSTRRLFVIASGGCTAFSLLAAFKDTPLNYRVDALDTSQAQIDLVKKKADLFKTTDFVTARGACIKPGGLNNCGWVDRRMAQLTVVFYALVHSRVLTKKFLLMSDVTEQKRFYEEKWCSKLWRLTMKMAFSRAFLYIAHGSAAAYLVPDDFAKIMEERLVKALTASPNAFNPYLWQAFFACYNDQEDALPPYLQICRSQNLLGNLSNLHLHCRDALDWFTEQPAQSFDYIGLSNILELLPSSYASALQKEVSRCLRPGGLICVRAIFPRKEQTFKNPDKEIDSTSNILQLDQALSKEAEHMDRSLFCNFYEIYRRA